MSDLPPCQYRAEQHAEHARCRHPRVHANSCVVRLAACRMCDRSSDVVAPRDCQTGPAGLGDTLAAIVAALGIHGWAGCGCARRRAALNRLVPWSRAAWAKRLGL